MDKKINIYARYLMNKDNSYNRFANQLSNKSIQQSYIEETDRVRKQMYEELEKRKEDKCIKELEEYAKEQILKEVKNMFNR